jgi:hypothetical protein
MLLENILKTSSKGQLYDCSNFVAKQAEIIEIDRKYSKGQNVYSVNTIKLL